MPSFLGFLGLMRHDSVPDEPLPEPAPDPHAGLPPPGHLSGRDLLCVLVPGMGYLGHPVVLRHLGLAPYAIDTPVLRSDLLYPRAGRHPSTNSLTPADLTAPSDGTPLDLQGPRHADYAEKRP